jgi:CRISPR-associated endoribonuclease Cas6
MRFTITLQALDRGAALPLSYQYPLSSWIYKTLEQADPDLAEFLHGEGYESGSHRRFKMYSFSELHTPGARVRGDRLILSQPEVSFTLGFLADDAAQAMIMGLFQRAEPSWLGEGISGGRFAVRSIKMEVLPGLLGSADYFTVSPVVVSVGERGEDGQMRKRFLSPFDAGYEEQFLSNLIWKYAVARKAGLLGAPDHEPEMKLELLSRQAKEKRIDLLKGQPGYTRVRGYKFRFRLHAPEPVLHLAMLAGVGEKNAMGFGAVEVIYGK